MLTGAGISTESGIPDYRSPRASGRPHKPMTYQEFVASESARRRYWARSSVGWRHMSTARPNDGHCSLVRLEQAGYLLGVVTQNVDGLHQAAGSREVIELHGSLASVRCLDCGDGTPRNDFQALLLDLNPRLASVTTEIAPDGDSYLPDEFVESFEVPLCRQCGGVLKPNVVFFGENVPRDRVADAHLRLAQASSLLVLGSSLTVMSGMRFVLAAERMGIPVAIINDGPTRGDDFARFRAEGRLGELLPSLASSLTC